MIGKASCVQNVSLLQGCPATGKISCGRTNLDWKSPILKLGRPSETGVYLYWEDCPAIGKVSCGRIEYQFEEPLDWEGVLCGRIEY